MIEMCCRSPRRSLACIMSLLHNTAFCMHYVGPSCTYMVVGPSPLLADLFSTHSQFELDERVCTLIAERQAIEQKTEEFKKQNRELKRENIQSKKEAEGRIKKSAETKKVLKRQAQEEAIKEVKRKSDSPLSPVFGEWSVPFYLPQSTFEHVWTFIYNKRVC